MKTLSTTDGGGATALGLRGGAAAQDLTVTSFGGAYGAAQKEHMIDPFVAEDRHQHPVRGLRGGIAEIKAQVEAGNIQWDVVDIEVIDLERACSEGYLEVHRPRDILPPGDDGTPAPRTSSPRRWRTNAASA
jgi:putative spermidine/putrescine transport system substrate-binding protein